MLSLSSSHYTTNALHNVSTAASTTPAYTVTNALHNNASVVTADSQTPDGDAPFTMDHHHRGSFVYGMRPRRARSRLCKYLGDYIAASRLSEAVSLDRLDFDEYDEVFILN